MKLQESGENYLETILILENRMGQVRSVDIAVELGFSKPSVSVAIKHFRENGYLTVEGGLIRLTDTGHQVAEHIYERHTILTQALVWLGVSEAAAREDACRIEHDISDETFQKIKDHLHKQTTCKLV